MYPVGEESGEECLRDISLVRISLEYFVPLDTFVVTDRDAGAVDKTDACTFTEAEQLQEKGHLDSDTRLQFYETVV